MSIYASLPAPDDDHAEGCGVWQPEGDDPAVLVMGDGPCTCRLRHAPLVYQGSNVLPADDDPRGGSIDLASIPGWIEREGRPRLEDDDDLWPFLRVGVNGETVVLDRAGVEQVARTLAEWLEATAP